MKRIFALMLACLMLAGCSSTPDDSGSGSETAPETVDVVLDW